MHVEARHDKAAQRIADGRWTDERIAAEAGVSRMTLFTWQKDPDFAARVALHTQRLHERIVTRGAAVKQKRLDGLVERLQLLWDVIAERAARGQETLAANTGLTPGGLPDPAGKTPIPGEVVTGLVVRSEKATLHQTIVEWAVDTGMLSEMRALEKQIAQELGEWTDRADLTSKGEKIGSYSDLYAAAQQALSADGQGNTDTPPGADGSAEASD